MTNSNLITLFEQLPFANHLGIELTEVREGHAEGHVPMRRELTSNPAKSIAHGGVTYSLADTVGGAAAFSVTDRITPTVDMRIDYLSPATTDLHAEADVRRTGASVAVVDVEVHDDEGTHVADARGVYKTSGPDGATAWV